MTPEFNLMMTVRPRTVFKKSLGLVPGVGAGALIVKNQRNEQHNDG